MFIAVLHGICSVVVAVVLAGVVARLPSSVSTVAASVAAVVVAGVLIPFVQSVAMAKAAFSMTSFDYQTRIDAYREAERRLFLNDLKVVRTRRGVVAARTLHGGHCFVEKLTETRERVVAEPDRRLAASLWASALDAAVEASGWFRAGLDTETIEIAARPYRDGMVVSAGSSEIARDLSAAIAKNFARIGEVEEILAKRAAARARLAVSDSRLSRREQAKLTELDRLAHALRVDAEEAKLLDPLADERDRADAMLAAVDELYSSDLQWTSASGL